MIHYQREYNLSPEEFRQILINSTLGERRPVEDKERLEAMIHQANLVISARDNNRLVGIARSLTDFVYCTYLSDLAVEVNYQKQGIGKELIRQTKLITPQAKLILLAAPKAIQYYPGINMQHHPHCYYLDNVKDLK